MQPSIRTRTTPIGGALALALLATGIAAPAGAQQSPPAPAATTVPKPAEEAPAWAVNCSNQGPQRKLACEMTQQLIDQRTRGQVLLISIKPADAGGATVMLVRMAHGVYLPAGVSVKIDQGQPTQLPFQKSDGAGVYAALPLTDKILADFKKGKELRFAMQVNQNEPLELVARLTGFGGAYDEANAKR